MNDKTMGRVVIAGLSVIFLILISWWFSVDPTENFIENVPGMDNRAAIESQAGPKVVVNIGEKFARSTGIPSEMPGSWPHFRGEHFDNISRDKTPLADSWPAQHAD